MIYVRIYHKNRKERSSYGLCGNPLKKFLFHSIKKKKTNSKQPKSTRRKWQVARRLRNGGSIWRKTSKSGFQSRRKFLVTRGMNFWNIRLYRIGSRDRDLRMWAMNKVTELGLQNFNESYKFIAYFTQDIK